MANLKGRFKDRDVHMCIAMIFATISLFCIFSHHIDTERAGRVEAMERAYIQSGEDPVTQELRVGRNGDCEKVVAMLVSDGYSVLMNNAPVDPTTAAIESACHSRKKSLTYWKPN